MVRRNYVRRSRSLLAYRTSDTLDPVSAWDPQKNQPPTDHPVQGPRSCPVWPWPRYLSRKPRFPASRTWRLSRQRMCVEPFARRAIVQALSRVRVVGSVRAPRKPRTVLDPTSEGSPYRRWPRNCVRHPLKFSLRAPLSPPRRPLPRIVHRVRPCGASLLHVSVIEASSLPSPKSEAQRLKARQMVP